MVPASQETPARSHELRCVPVDLLVPPTQPTDHAMNTTLWRLCLVGTLCSLAACGSDDTGAGGSGTGTEDTGLIDRDDDVRVRPEPPAPDVTDTPDTEPPVEPDVIGSDADSGPRPDTDTPSTSNCGNGIREFGEICDGEDFLPGASCQVAGFIGGELACSPTCDLVTAGCYMELCGDGLISGTEDCDGTELGGATCATLGFAPNGDDAVTCDDCTFDTTQCSDSICGNENIETGFEVCDGTLFGGETCRTQGFFTGTLTCVDDCTGIDTSDCVENVCGNGTIEGPELCDGGFASVTCRDVEVPEGDGENFVGGLIGCSETCLELDTSGCVADIEDLGVDTDEDGIPDELDNCPDDYNPRQLDFTGNGVGNVCDDPITFNVLATEGAPFLLRTSGQPNAGGGIGGLLGGIGAIEFDLEVVAGTVTFSLDDEGEIFVSALRFELGEQTVPLEIDAGGGGFPGFDLGSLLGDIDLELEIRGGFIESQAGAAGEFTAAGTFAQYVSGEITAANTSFGTVSRVDTATTGELKSAILASSSTTLSTYDRAFTFTFADPGYAWGATAVAFDLGGGGGGFPIPIPGGFGLDIDIDLVGLAGSVMLVEE
jgi:hypothetical protein